MSKPCLLGSDGRAPAFSNCWARAFFVRCGRLGSVLNLADIFARTSPSYGPPSLDGRLTPDAATSSTNNFVENSETRQ
jgi:hypothetical protein